MPTSEDEGGGTQCTLSNYATTDENTSFSDSDDNSEHEEVNSSGMESPVMSGSSSYMPPNKKMRKNSNESTSPGIKMKSEWSKSYSGYSEAAVNIMQKMGYKGDEGLGKEGQGILKPIEASRQEGRRGFGLRLDDLDAASAKWDPSMENIQLSETVNWLKNNDIDFLNNLTMDDLDNWTVTGPQKLIIDDESHFCDSRVLENVLTSKSVFDNLNAGDMRKARTRSNPFETIRGNIFLNRAAVKMANIDAICKFMFTNPVDENGRSLVKNDDLLYFADICAGPGGFSEYILYRKKWEAKGFGFTLRGDNDFKLTEFLAGPPETFDPHYGVKNNGDIYDPENQESFADYVLRQTESGVHFVMADGGFSVEKQENIQEILSKQLYLCQCLVALSILREKGHFVCKMFDLFTPFSVGLIYLMYKCFEEITICKPNTSRPANSERYLICKWKKSNTETIRRHFSEINKKICSNDPNNDILHLVDINILKQDKEFFEYIYESNNTLGKNQIIGLIKIAAYCKDDTLKENNQADYKMKSLKLWNLPDQIRTVPDTPTNESLLEELLKEWKDDKTMMSVSPLELNKVQDLEKRIRYVYDWHFVPVCREETKENVKSFFLSKGKTNVLKYCSGRWEPVECCLEISPKTLIYGEIVTELMGEGRSQNKVKALHIIDGIVLGGIDIHREPLQERIRMCTKFAKALNKPYKTTNVVGNYQPVAPIRCKKLYALNEIQVFFNAMRHYKLKDGTSRLGFRIRSDDPSRAERFFVPGGLMFFNETNPPFVKVLSRSKNKFYYHNETNKEAYYVDDLPKNVRAATIASFRGSYYRRLLWKWTNIYQVEENVNDDNRQEDILYRDDLNNYILRISTR
ncbi:cap-specific mRNA (nucleoside-2'-O-)-methyltransferase 1 [Condylostylus longicornis]|uniref:cap-specific mRNA (nucleoside-2'-O-)-methyltransferase 1 n=1 Tax=Condylostylus longicornis TaxID=2530218 RepID=UPI00244E1082|nr:cap-specific mRNA (nucleoside-2'-O-)-methyltransferase 1 [Condylostylus longicornis]